MKTLYTLALAALLSSAPLMAVQQAATYEDAAKKAKDDGILIYMYGAGWDKIGEKMLTTLWKSREIDKIAGQAIMLTLPVYQNPTEAEKKTTAKILGNYKLPNGIASYPCILMLDRNGRPYATIQGNALTESPSQAVKTIRSNMDKLEQRTKLVQQAEKAQGLEKAKLLGKTCDLGIATPDKLLDMIKQADPDDKSGYVRRLQFSPWALGDQIKELDADEAVSRVRRMADDPAYTPHQKQEMYAVLTGKLRRNSPAYDMKKLRTLFEEMRDFDPESMYGVAAASSIDAWCTTFSLARGWSPRIFDDGGPVELEGSHPVKDKGTYIITFNYQRGMHALGVKSVAVYDGNTLVAQDKHNASAGRNAKDNTYTLKVPKPLKNPRIVCEFEQNGGKDTYGSLSIKKQ